MPDASVAPAVAPKMKRVSSARGSGRGCGSIDGRDVPPDGPDDCVESAGCPSSTGERPGSTLLATLPSTSSGDSAPASPTSSVTGFSVCTTMRTSASARCAHEGARVVRSPREGSAPLPVVRTVPTAVPDRTSTTRSTAAGPCAFGGRSSVRRIESSRSLSEGHPLVAGARSVAETTTSPIVVVSRAEAGPMRRMNATATRHARHHAWSTRAWTRSPRRAPALPGNPRRASNLGRDPSPARVTWASSARSPLGLEEPARPDHPCVSRATMEPGTTGTWRVR